MPHWLGRYVPASSHHAPLAWSLCTSQQSPCPIGLVAMYQPAVTMPHWLGRYVPASSHHVPCLSHHVLQAGLPACRGDSRGDTRLCRGLWGRWLILGCRLTSLGFEVQVDQGGSPGCGLTFYRDSHHWICLCHPPKYWLSLGISAFLSRSHPLPVL